MKHYLKQNKLFMFFTILFTAFSSLSYVFMAILLQKLLDAVIQNDMSEFRRIVCFSILYFSLMGLFAFIQSLLTKKLICRVIKSVRTSTFSGILHHTMEDFTKKNTADYLSAMTNDIKILEENYLLPLFEVIQYTIIFAASLVVMIYFDFIVTACVIVCILCMLLIPGLFGKILENRQSEYSKALSKFTIKVKDFLSGFEVMKSYRLKAYILSSFGENNEETIHAKYAADKVMAANEAVSMILSLSVQIVVLFLSAYFILIGRITAGALLGMIQVSSNLANPLLMIFNNLPKMKSIEPIAEHLNQLRDYTSTSFNGMLSPVFDQTISAEHLSFSYDKAVPVLTDISLEIQKNKKYAIVGKSGCGKSTLVKLLTGYYADYEGRILYDGNDIHTLDIDQTLALSSTIHQNVYLFDESIYDNICLHQSFTQEQLEYALQASGLSAFIHNLSEGIKSPVGENGSSLSGGQKQRIAVARALIRKKPLLILDEGTSAIDMQTAYDIESHLLHKKDLTLLTITHHMSSDILKLYDEIIYMENGQITEKGRFEDLIKENKQFCSFFHAKINC